MSGADEQKVITGTGSNTGVKRMRLDSDECKNQVGMLAAHEISLQAKFQQKSMLSTFALQDYEKKLFEVLVENKKMVEKLETVESACNNFQKMVEELSAENEVCELAI